MGHRSVDDWEQSKVSRPDDHAPAERTACSGDDDVHARWICRSLLR